MTCLWLKAALNSESWATDVLQFLVLIVIFPLMAFLLLHKAGGIEAVLSQVPADRWHVWGHPHFSFYLTLFLMWGLFSLEMIDPAIMQRMLMTQKGSQLRDQFLVVVGLILLFAWSLCSWAWLPW